MKQVIKIRQTLKAQFVVCQLKNIRQILLKDNIGKTILATIFTTSTSNNLMIFLSVVFSIYPVCPTAQDMECTHYKSSNIIILKILRIFEYI